MKTPILVLAAMGTIGFALAAPAEAQAGNVHFDIHVAIPAVVHRPHVVYRPAVVHHPRAIHHHHHVHRPHHRYEARHHHHGHASHAQAYEQPRALGRIGVNSRLYP